MKTVVLVVLLILSACANGAPLPKIEGPWHALNPTYWTPNEQDQAMIKSLPE